MNVVALVSGSSGYDAKIAVKDYLASAERAHIGLGVSHKGTNCDSSPLVDHFAALVGTGQCQNCIAFSRTGNEFQMWANKHPNLFTTPILSHEMALETVQRALAGSQRWIHYFVNWQPDALFEIKER